MTIIIPSTDLRNRFSEVESLARQTREPIYLTKNGRGSLVLMDIDAFEEHLANAAYRYQAMETAIAELLDEPFSLDGEGSDDGSRHATA